MSRPEAGFALADWIIIAAYLLLTTFVGARLAGKQTTIRDFFLGGRKLPWWAISGSIIATEISAVTFIAVPSISFADGGDFTYLQLAIGAVLARIIIGCYFVPRYYQREIYSPYDYMGQRLGTRVKKTTTWLFFVGAVLGQGARVYVTAFVLSVITGFDLTSSIWVIGAFSVCWTLLGGMTTVIWTDVIQFGVLTLGALLTLWYSISAVPGSITEVIRAAADAGKLNCLNLSTDPALPYTLWCGLLATPFLNLAAFGTDQVMAQRMFCCRDQRDATKAIIVSSVGIGVALLMLCVGAALYGYFEHHPFTPEEAELYEAKNTYLLPIFIVRAVPVGVRGIIIAAVFASAVSTLDSALAALAQTTTSAFVKPALARRRARGRLRRTLSSEIGLSKVLVVGWGVVLCLMATACIVIADQYANAVDLALALVGYTYGPLLGILLLAIFPLNRDDAGLAWAVPMTILAIFAMSQHNVLVTLPGALPPFDLTDWIVWIGAGAALLLGLFKLQHDPSRVAAVVAALFIVLLHHYQAGTDATGKPAYLAFTWSYPIGTVMTFALGYCLGRPKPGPRVGKRGRSRRTS
ncbi:MAG: sodium/solute symporter [Phycisphaerae bacterium]|nr:sodium/solute symporter [Phycisphaerae bacterium]